MDSQHVEPKTQKGGAKNDDNIRFSVQNLGGKDICIIFAVRNLIGNIELEASINPHEIPLIFLL